MQAHVIGERRREPRRVPDHRSPGAGVQVPGVRVLEVLDVSAHGLRCRLAQPVRPGRPSMLRVTTSGGPAPCVAFVVRCEVVRLSRHAIQYEAGWMFERGWPEEY